MLSVVGTCTKFGVPVLPVDCGLVPKDGCTERPVVAGASPLGVLPNVSVGNRGLTPALRIPDAAALVAGTGFTPKPVGFAAVTGAAVTGAAVVGNGNCPQLVARVVGSRCETGGVPIVEAPSAEATGFAPAELVKGGTENDGGFVAVVEGSVVPLVTPCDEADGAIGRPARSTF